MTTQNETEKIKKLKVLVVDDREENRAAAQSYFATRPELEADFAGSYDEAISKLETEMYGAAILDVEIPRKTGEKTEKLGLELSDLLNCTPSGKYRIPSVLLTGGYDHSGLKTKIFFDRPFYEHDSSEAMVVDKVNPEAWKSAFEVLEKEFTMPTITAILEARERYRKFIGRNYGSGENRK